MASDSVSYQDIPLPKKQVSLDPEQRKKRSGDFGTPEAMRVLPDVVVWPTSTEEVSRLLSWAHERRVAVTPIAAGTGLGGHSVPVNQGISLDMTRMDRVLELREKDLQMEVEAGVYGKDIQCRARKHGLFFPPPPASEDISTIGGMISTDASGMHTVKYGEVRQWVLWLQAVLADGTVIEAGSRASKSSSGYNLKDLLVGSEGTLCVVTRAVLRLAGRPDIRKGGRAVFPSLDSAAGAVSDVVRFGPDVARLELLDALTVKVANRYSGLDLPVRPTLFFEFHGDVGVDERLSMLRKRFQRRDVDRFDVAEKGAGMEELWRMRHDLAYALREYQPRLNPHHDGDVTVPVGCFPAIVSRIQKLGEEHDFLIPCFGHAGDGNVHYTILLDPADRNRVKTAEEVNERIVRAALEMGGTCTGEHGIGLTKRSFLTREHGQEAVEVMRSVKRALDPKGILNPGKIFPDDGDTGDGSDRGPDNVR